MKIGHRFAQMKTEEDFLFFSQKNAKSDIKVSGTVLIRLKPSEYDTEHKKIDGNL